MFLLIYIILGNLSPLSFIPANFWCVRQCLTRERTDQFFGSKDPAV
jgi:hypothetical protein